MNVTVRDGLSNFIWLIACFFSSNDNVTKGREDGMAAADSTNALGFNAWHSRRQLKAGAPISDKCQHCNQTHLATNLPFFLQGIK